MKNPLLQDRRPVRRHNAHLYVLVLLISFSASVILTRLFLILTGFPKIGGGELHIAHLLWGGLLLFISIMLLLIFANRWIYTLCSVLGGVGIGLFIDEVGKFITQSNDYFYPLAIPIIYAFFLIVVVLYLRVRRIPSRDARAELYRALDMFGELLDRDLEPSERQDLQERLSHIVQVSDNPDIKRLAQSLLDLLSAETIQLAPERPSIFAELNRRLQSIEQTWLGERRLKIILTIGLAVTGILAIGELISLILAPQSPEILRNAVTQLMATGEIRGTTSLFWFLIRLAVEGTIGLLLLLASLLLILGQDRRGNELGYIGLLFSLTIVNLLVFYFDQFGNIVLTLIELLLLLGIIQHKQRYLRKFD